MWVPVVINNPGTHARDITIQSRATLSVVVCLEYEGNSLVNNNGDQFCWFYFLRHFWTNRYRYWYHYQPEHNNLEGVSLMDVGTLFSGGGSDQIVTSSLTLPGPHQYRSGTTWSWVHLQPVSGGDNGSYVWKFELFGEPRSKLAPVGWMVDTGPDFTGTAPL